MYVLNKICEVFLSQFDLVFAIVTGFLVFVLLYHLDLVLIMHVMRVSHLLMLLLGIEIVFAEMFLAFSLFLFWRYFINSFLIKFHIVRIVYVFIRKLWIFLILGQRCPILRLLSTLAHSLASFQRWEEVIQEDSIHLFCAFLCTLLLFATFGTSQRLLSLERDTVWLGCAIDSRSGGNWFADGGFLARFRSGRFTRQSLLLLLML